MQAWFVAGVILLAATRAGAADAFDPWVDRLTAEWVRLDPQFATAVQFFPPAQQAVLDQQLTPVTTTHRQRRIELAKQALVDLKRFEPETLSAEQQSSAAMLEWLLEDAVASDAFARHDFVFEQFRGLHVTLVNFLTQTHPLRHRRDADNYLARLAQVDDRLDEGREEAQAAAAAGFLPPRFILDRTLEQLRHLTSGEAAEHVLVRTFGERLQPVAELPPEEQEALRAAAEQRVRDEVLPALQRVEAMLREQRPHTDDVAGLHRLPGGADAYAQALRTHTTTDLAAKEIHAIGRREVARLEAEMDAILRSLGYTDGSVAERFAALEAARQPPVEPDPRPALLARYKDIVRAAEVRAADVFDLRPRAPVEVRREPAFTERTAAAHYNLPAPDGSRPGVFWVPLPGPHFDLLRMRSLAYHEAVPGHHFQVALQQEMTSLPRFRRDRVFGGLSVYVEGWALYAERLADELDWYADDPEGKLGYLHSQLFRARRLVVDTGLHALGWTREEAIAYGIRAQEVERYVVLPGQACSYMMGQLKLLDLRERARERLGPAFSLREFHSLVLRAGAVPLAVLEARIEAWIEQRSRLSPRT